MIGRLRGTLQQKLVEEVIVDVGGVGYAVVCPLSVLEALPPEGAAAELVVHTHVREDQLVLYGFRDADERALFRLLISTTGIGPKLAMAALGGMTAERVARAIVDADVKALASIPGIGKRTAERIVLELKEKARALSPGRPLAAPAPTSHLDDLASALRNLGYPAKEVEKLVAGLTDQAPTLSFEALLREALRRLAG
ncbi:MAG: Holliday junction branch migration protein RuvA [Myxococcales bacterium]|nr:Holliday junction branch migration protein RuvA [Myxococcales bacterium]